ncbi:hypothetical protein [Bradyrhizobium yuanmingense]|uniref:hypothetical protein n=1 Tax=Bradyrhizobium yuanmingense TaxID=108015 RepID=UPI0029FA6C43|nr:hypothetical protein [Bradyrhizobium yuanmingense]MCA1550127.1 hypothetical protein [Bradyrhizobium sp. BRP19]
MPEAVSVRSARQALQVGPRLRGEGIIAMARNEELKGLPRTLPAGSFIFLGHRSGRISRHRHGGRAPCLAAVVCFGPLHHHRQSSETLMGQSSKRNQGAKQAGRECASFHETLQFTGVPGTKLYVGVPYDYGI